MTPDETADAERNRLTEVAEHVTEAPPHPVPGRAALEARAAAIGRRRRVRASASITVAVAAALALIVGLAVRSGPDAAELAIGGPGTTAVPAWDGPAPPPLDPDRPLALTVTPTPLAMGTVGTLTIANRGTTPVSGCVTFSITRWDGTGWLADDADRIGGQQWIDPVTGTVHRFPPGGGGSCSHAPIRPGSARALTFDTTAIRSDSPTGANPTGEPAGGGGATPPDTDGSGATGSPLEPGWYSINLPNSRIEHAGQFLVAPPGTPAAPAQPSAPPPLDSDRALQITSDPDPLPLGTAGTLVLANRGTQPWGTCHHFALVRWDGSLWVDAGTIGIGESGRVHRYPNPVAVDCQPTFIQPGEDGRIPFDPARATIDRPDTTTPAASTVDPRFAPLTPGWYALAEDPEALLGQFQLTPPTTSTSTPITATTATAPTGTTTAPGQPPSSLPATDCRRASLENWMLLPRRRWASVDRSAPRTMEEAFGQRTVVVGRIGAVTARGGTPIDRSNPAAAADWPASQALLEIVRDGGVPTAALVTIDWILTDDRLADQRDWAAAAPSGCPAALVLDRGAEPGADPATPPGATLVVQADDGTLISDDDAHDLLLAGATFADIARAAGR